MYHLVAKKGIWILFVLLLCAWGASAQTTFYRIYYRAVFSIPGTGCSSTNFTLTASISGAGGSITKTSNLSGPPPTSPFVIVDNVYVPWRPSTFRVNPWSFSNYSYVYQGVIGDAEAYAATYTSPSPGPNCQPYLRQLFPWYYQYECVITNTNPQISYCGDETVTLTVPQYPTTGTWEISSDGVNYLPFKTTGGNVSFNYYDVLNSGVSNPDGPLNFRATIDYGNNTIMHPAVVSGIVFTKPVPSPGSMVAAPPPCAGDNGTITLSNFSYADGSSYSGAIPLVAKFQDVNTGDVYTSPQFSTASYSMALPTGTYQVKITSPSSSCVKDMGNAPAIGAAPPALVLAEPGPSCNGGTPAFSLSASGGTAPYTFSIDGVSNPDGDNIFTGLAAATSYTLRVADSHQCKTSLTRSTQATVSASLSSKSDPTAPNAADGSITVTAGGGAGAPFTYSLDNINWQSGNVFSGLTKGSYSIRVKDKYGCTNATALPVTLQDPQPVVVTPAVTQISCYGAADGSVTVNATGGTPPFTYSIDGVNFLSIKTFDNLAAGGHTAWAKDSKGSTSSANFTVTMPAALNISVSSQQDVPCKGMSNGKITVSASGGTGVLQYALNTDPFQAQTSFTVPAGQYTVTVMDDNGCSKGTPQINITEPAQAVTVNASTTAVNCYGEASGSISAVAANGASPYQYQLNSGAWQSAGAFNNLPIGTYTVNVQDNNGCPASQSNINITQPAALSIAQDALTDASCFNATDGSIKVSAAGGTGIVQYYISTAPTVPNSSGVFNGLAAGSYSITAKDEHNCSATLNAQVGQPVLLQLNATATDATCYGNANGSVSLQAAGGTASYLYSADGVSFNNSNVFNNLPAGNYTYYVKDSHGCSASKPVTVSQPTALTFTSTVSDALCKGSATGTITVGAAGGTGAYQYNIDGNPFQSANVLNNIAAGTRLVGVMDANSCVKTSNVFVGEPAALTLQVVNQQSVSCFGGSNGALTLQAGGGAGSYQYALNGGAYQVSATFSGLSAGAYSVMVKDANGCTFSIPASVTQPAQLSLQLLNKTDILCAGAATGNMQLQGSGGISPYLYSINGAAFQTNAYYGQLPAGSYAITLKDSKGCTSSLTVSLVDQYPPLSASLTTVAPATCNDKGSITVTNIQGGLSPYAYSLDNTNYTASPVFNNLYSGNYTVYIKDANACALSRSTSLQGPAGLQGSLQVQPALCKNGSNGSIKVSRMSGGNNVYEYSLDGVNYQSAAQFTNLKAGQYQVYVRDVPYSCQLVLSGEVKEPSALMLQLTNNTPVSCFNGSNGALTVQASGGTGAYTFSLNAGSFGASSSFGGLSAGSYTITVKDANGCSSQLSATVAQPVQLTATISARRDVSCSGKSDGELTISANGGSAPYSYSIDGLNYQSSPVFGGLQKGNYLIRVKDNNACVLQISGAVAEPAALQLQVLQASGIDCFGNASGKISIAGAGGSGAYTYTLNNLPGQPSGVFDNLTAGTYLLSVSDANACTARQSITLQQPALLQLSKQVQQPGCSDASNGSIALTLSGGVTPYTYSWSNGAGSSTLSKLGGGLYKVTVTDANGCWLKDSTQLDQPAPVQTGIGFTDTVLCVGQSLMLDAGNPGAAYSWVSDAGFSSRERIVQLNQDGHYKLTVTSSTGCAATDSFALQTSVAALKADFLLSSYGTVNDTVIVVDVSKPAPLSHEWTLPAGAREAGSAGAGGIRQLIFDQPGDYTIKMLVTLGECADVISKSITILPAGQQEEADSLLGYRERLIKEVTAYPNPNDGPFKVRVKLSKAADIQLKLISFNSGNVVAIQKAGGTDYYEIPFDASQLPQGVYLVAVEVEKEYQVIRVLKM